MWGEHRYRAYAYLIVWCYLCLYTMRASEAAELEQVDVHASSTDSEQGEADSTVSSAVIRMSEIDDRSVSVPELLNQVAGVRVTQLGGLVDFATISIRGSTSEQVHVYLDGVLLNQAAGGGVNLSSLSPESIESITIYRGQAPARFGSNAIGGLVDIKSKKAKDERPVESSQRYGSWHTYEGSLLYADKIKKTRFVTSYQYHRSQGDYFFLDDNGTPANLNDDQRVRRKNNAFAQHFLSGHVKHEFGKDWNLELTNNFFREDRGIPGLGTLTSDTASLDTTRNVTRTELAWQAQATLKFTMAPFFSFSKSQFDDQNGEIGLGVQDNDDESFTYGGQLHMSYLINSHHNAGAYLSYQGEQFHPQNFVSTPSQGTPSVRNQVTLSLEDEMSFFSDQLILNPSVQFSAIFNDLSGDDPSNSPSTPDSDNKFPVSGKIGFRYQITKEWAVSGNGGRAYRPPNFLELFGDRGAIVGNAALIPEKSWNFDLGIAWIQKNHQVHVNYFENHSDDLIQFLQTSQFTAKASNLASATVRGMELSAATQPFRFLRLQGNYTFQWAKDGSGRTGFDGKFLPGRPKHQVYLGAVTSYQWFKFFADFDFIDQNFLDRFNSQRVNNRWLLATGIGVEPLDWLSISFEVKNVLDQQIEDAAGFPVPGRFFTGKVTIEL
jgi:outer membrane cobalamin receptor